MPEFIADAARLNKTRFFESDAEKQEIARKHLSTALDVVDEHTAPRPVSLSSSPAAYVDKSGSHQSILGVVVLLMLLAIVLAGAVAVFQEGPTSIGRQISNASIEAVHIDDQRNVNFLELRVNGQRYLCRPTLDSMAIPQIHCDPDGPQS